MELIYSTNVLTDANRLSLVLTEAGLFNHVSGTYSAQLTGFLATNTPASICVWLASASDLPRAQEIMLAHGFLEQPSISSSRTIHRNSIWLVLGGTILAIILVALLVQGP